MMRGPFDAPLPYDVVTSQGTGSSTTLQSSSANGIPKMPNSDEIVVVGSNFFDWAFNVFFFGGIEIVL